MRPLNILVLEDMLQDFYLIKRTLRGFMRSHLILHANSEATFKQALEEHPVDVVLADYLVPGFSGMEALMHVHEHHPQLVFVFVTGALKSEELAANTILAGANGFLLKDNMESLPGILEDAIARKRKEIILSWFGVNQHRDSESFLATIRQEPLFAEGEAITELVKTTYERLQRAQNLYARRASLSPTQDKLRSDFESLQEEVNRLIEQSRTLRRRWEEREE